MKEDITNQKVWSTKQLIIILFFTISSVFSLTMIYARFIYMEQQIEISKEYTIQQFKILNERLEKKTKRIETDNKNQWNAINEVQKK